MYTQDTCTCTISDTTLPAQGKNLKIYGFHGLHKFSVLISIHESLMHKFFHKSEPDKMWKFFP